MENSHEFLVIQFLCFSCQRLSLLEISLASPRLARRLQLLQRQYRHHSWIAQLWQHQQLNSQRAMDHLVAHITLASSNNRNPVKEEIKYVRGRVSTPIRRFTGTDGRKIKLKGVV
jgi:hypothetical protein